VARAAVFACRDKGAEVSILNRTPETAQKLARQAGAKTIKHDAVAKTHFDVIINCTPVGMTGFKGTPLLTAEDLNARLVFDTVYNPLETPLLRMARSKGIAVISGVEMFVQQGVRQFEIWTGKPAPVDDMLRVVLHSLRQAAEAAGEAPGAMPPVTKLEAPAPAAPVAEPEPAKVAKAPPAPTSKSAPAKEVKAAAPAKAASAPPAKTAPAKAVAVKTAPAKAAAVKTAPAKAVSAKAAAKPAPAKAVPAKAPAKAAAKPSNGKAAKPAVKSKPASKSAAKRSR